MSSTINKTEKKETKKIFLKTALAAIITAIVIMLGFSFSLAYLMNTDEGDTEYSFAYDEIDIIDDYEGPAIYEPGCSFKKDVKIKNIGTSQCYVRVFAEIQDAIVNDYSSIDFNTNDWTEKQSDGYYYYKKILEPGATTESLFTRVKIADNIRADSIRDFNMDIVCESVQAKKHDLSLYENAEDAFQAFLTNNVGE